MNMEKRTLQELLKESFASMTDGHILARHKERQYTTLEIKQSLTGISQELAKKGIARGAFIGLLIEDRVKMLEGILGTLDLGCVFVPIETDYSASVIREMLKTASVNYVLTDIDCSRYQDIFQECGVTLIHTDDCQYTADQTEGIFRGSYELTDPIYVYFTSGTTSKPKAILGQNQGLSHFIDWEAEKVGCESLNVSQITSPCHDPFLRDIFLAIRLGGQLCIPESKATILDGNALIKWLIDDNVNILHCTPSVFNHMVITMETTIAFPDLKYVFLAGEKVNSDALKRWYQFAVGDYKLENLYGPTETTLAKFCHDIVPEDCENGNIPVGRPIEGTTAYILDDDMRLCETGEEGEIYISTIYRSLGYLGNDQLNQSLFIQSPFLENEILYKTGDMGRFLENGLLQICGRKDNQVKIRGNRVELDYVESRITEIPGVQECTTVFDDSELGKEFIAAYVVADPGCTKIQIVDYLREQVPDYMIPSFIVFMESLPLNNNMKVDKKRLPDPRELLNAEKTNTSSYSETEKKVADICAETLELNSVDIEENFFTLGGTSLNVMQFISRLFDVFGVEISLEDVFLSPSLREFATVIDEKLMLADDTDTQDSEYTIEMYDQKLKNGYRYHFNSDPPVSCSIENITPFNAVFYRSCIYNAIFAVMDHYNADELPVFTNDVILYGTVEDIDSTSKVRYLGEKTLEEILDDSGIKMLDRHVQQHVIEEIIASINRKHPVIIGVDCFYESVRKEFYKKSSWPHNILVYGYDNETQEMIVLEHTGINNLDYHEQRISYLDIDYAYNSNRIKFPTFEQGRYYLEFEKSDISASISTEDLFRQYVRRIFEHLTNIRTNIASLSGILALIEKNTSDLDVLKKNNERIIKLLDAIIEAKSAQVYMFERLTSVGPVIREGKEQLSDILKRWKLVRNVIYKTVITGVYNDESVIRANKEIAEIPDMERKFYDWFKNELEKEI